MPSEHRTFPRLHKLPYALMKHIQEVRVQHKDQRKKWEKNLQKEWMKQLSEMYKNFSHLRPPDTVVNSTWLAEPLALFTTEYSTVPYFLKGPEAAELRWELVVVVRKAVRDMDSTSSTWQGACIDYQRSENPVADAMLFSSVVELVDSVSESLAPDKKLSSVKSLSVQYRSDLEDLAASKKVTEGQPSGLQSGTFYDPTNGTPTAYAPNSYDQNPGEPGPSTYGTFDLQDAQSDHGYSGGSER